MKITRNKNTPEGRSFWAKVAECVERVKRMSQWERNCPVIATAKKVGSKKGAPDA